MAGVGVVVVMECTGLLSHHGSSRPDLPNPASPLCVHPPTPNPLHPFPHPSQISLCPSRAEQEQRGQQENQMSLLCEDFKKTGAALPGRGPGKMLAVGVFGLRHTPFSPVTSRVLCTEPRE